MYHDQFQLCHADHWGAACTRSRMLKLSKGDAPVDLSAVQKRPSIDINSLLEPGWRSPISLARCVVSSERTHNPPVVCDPAGQMRQLYEGEADRIMGYPDGVSYPGYTITPRQRRAMIGGGFHYLHTYCALRLLDPPTPQIPHPAVTAMPTLWKEATQDHWERSWLEYSDQDMRQCMRDKVGAHDYRPPELKLKEKADAGPNARPHHKYSIAPGLATALDFAIQKHDDLGFVVRDVPF